MKPYFSVSEGAALAGLTSETLRHYDRIGLVKPSHRDQWSSYRYYTRRDIVRLNTIQALARMDLSLVEIKQMLEYDDLSKIIASLEQAERRADEKIRELELGKEKIRLARASYERMLHGRRKEESFYTANLPRRVILLSETLEEPSLDNLWNYLGHFYSAIPPEQRSQFEFEDMAGVYREGGRSRMFAQCLRQGSSPNLKELPAGTYLCADCTPETRTATQEALLARAREEYGAAPEFVVQIVVISGILQWNYRIQVLISEAP